MIKIIDNFITEEQEQEILSLVKKSTVKRGINRNTIVRYGSVLPYRSQMLGAIPDWALPLCQRLVDEGLSPELPDSVTVNEYFEGQVIDWHIDSVTSGPVINVISLLSSAKMGLKKGSEKKEFILQPRSLVHMSEEERYNWKHCIFPVDAKRFSIVFRKGTPLTRKDERSA